MIPYAQNACRVLRYALTCSPTINRPEAAAGAPPRGRRQASQHPHPPLCFFCTHTTPLPSSTISNPIHRSKTIPFSHKFPKPQRGVAWVHTRFPARKHTIHRTHPIAKNYPNPDADNENHKQKLPAPDPSSFSNRVPTRPPSYPAPKTTKDLSNSRISLLIYTI